MNTVPRRYTVFFEAKHFDDEERKVEGSLELDAYTAEDAIVQAQLVFEFGSGPGGRWDDLAHDYRVTAVRPATVAVTPNLKG